jgi:hypothetical protein
MTFLMLGKIHTLAVKVALTVELALLEFQPSN